MTVTQELATVKTQYKEPEYYADLLQKVTKADFIDDGAYGAVFRIAEGIVAKVGRVMPDEVERQRYMASQEVAVPVLYYAERFPTCFLHNKQCYRNHAGDPDGTDCGNYMNVLVMPEALDVPMSRRYTAEVTNFREYISSLVQEKFGEAWDDELRHVKLYEGHLVAIDLGGW